jgi:phosphotransferase system HPr (HPr) family protein
MPAMPASSDPPEDGHLAPSESQSAAPHNAVPSGDEAILAVTLPSGVALHARPAADLVRAASRLPVQVTVSANGKRANAMSILEVLALGATGGTELTLSATGSGAEDAVRALAEVIAGFGV